MAKSRYSNDEVTKLLASRVKQADAASEKIGAAGGLGLVAEGDFKTTFDYIEKFTGAKSSLSDPTVEIAKNYAKAQYQEAKQKARDQGPLSEFAGFAAQSVVGEIALGTVDGLGYLLDFTHWGDKLMGGEGDWGNWASDYAESGKEWIRKAAPIYQDPDNAGRDTWENMLHGDGWWAENGVSVASSLSILLPVAGWARGLGLAGKGLNALGTAARVGKWGGKVAKAVSTVDKVLDLMPMLDKTGKLVLEGVHKATVSRLIESQMEATAVFKDRYEAYKESGMSEEEAKQAADRAATFTYKANWAGLLTDLPQYLALGQSGRFLKGTLGAKLPGWVQDSKILTKTKGLRNVGAQMFSEGLEESYQFIVSEEGKRVGDITAGLVDANDTTLGERLTKYSKDSEMWTSALFGALGGGVFTAAGPISQKLINKTFRRGEQFLDENDVRKQEELSRMTRVAADVDLLNKAIQSGDEEAIFAAKGNMSFNLAANAVVANNYDKARAAMAQLKNATPEEKEQYGIDENFAANIDEHLGYMDAAADILDRAKGKYTYGLAEGIARRQFDQYLYTQQMPKLRNKFDEELRNTIPNIDQVSKDGNNLMEEAIKIKAMEKANSNKEALIKQGKIDPEAVAYWEQSIELGKATIAARQAALNEIIKGSDVLNEYDRQALEAIEGGTADSVVSLATKMQLAEEKNKKTGDELKFYTSREGRRQFLAARAEKDKQEKIQRAKEAQNSKAKEAREAAANPEAVVKKGKSLKDINIKDVAAKVEAGAKFEDFVDNPEDLLALKKAVADFKIMREQNPNIEKEEAEEDALLGEMEGGVTFTEEEEVQEEVLNETEDVETDADIDAKETLAEEIASSEAHEEIEVPINPREDKNWRVGDDLENPKLARETAQLAWLSSNNPEAKNVTEANKALSAFLEDPGTNVREYEVEMEVNREYLLANKSNPIYKRIMVALSKGEMPTPSDTGDIPMKAKIMKGGVQVIHNGIALEMSLHDPNFFFDSKGRPKYAGVSEVLAQMAIQHKQAILKQILQGNKVTTKLSGKSRGKLNIEIGSKKYVAQTLKKKVDKITFLVGSKTGSYVNAKKRPRLVLGASATPGAIYTEIQTANGQPFPLRLEVNNLSTAEATLIHALYVDILSNPELVTANLGDNILKYITESSDPRIKGLNGYLSDIENMTYQDLLSHLVYEGSRTIAKGDYVLTHYINTSYSGKPLPNTVQFGKTKLPVDRLETAEGKEAFITWITTNKRRQIDANRLEDIEYKTYLNDSQVLTTNVAPTATGHLFVQPVITFNTNMKVSAVTEADNQKELERQKEEIIKEGTVDAVDTLKADLEFEKSSEFGGNPEIIEALESQIESLEEVTTAKEITETVVKPEVLDVYNDNTVLQEIGTAEQYSQYLDTVFPDSKVKDIVYHHSSQKIDHFNKSFLGKETGAPDTQLGFFFAENSRDIPNMVAEKNAQLKQLGSDKVLNFSVQNNVLINIKNPEYYYGFIEEAVSNILGRDASVLSETARDDYAEARLKLEKSGKDSLVYGLSTDYDDGDHNVNHGYVILEPENIYVLGSKQDIEGFKKFTGKDSLELKGNTVSTIANTIKMFQAGVKTATGQEITVKLPDNKEFKENPC